MNKILILAGTGLERIIRLVLVFLAIVAIPGLAIIAVPDFIKIDWSKDMITFVIIFIVFAVPILSIFLRDKKASLKNIPSNIKEFIIYKPVVGKSSFPVLKLIIIINIIVLVGQLLAVLMLS
jgi:hypothetical protein